MRFILLIILILLILTGCTTLPKISDTQIVNKAIPVKCQPTMQVTEIKEYPTDKMTKEMTLYEKGQLALAENDLLRGQNKELKAALNECTK